MRPLPSAAAAGDAATEAATVAAELANAQVHFAQLAARLSALQGAQALAPAAAAIPHVPGSMSGQLT